MDNSEIDKKIEELEEKKQLALKDTENLRKVENMPFYMQIQVKGFEDLLDRVYKTQKSAFQRICKKDKIHKDDWKDEFCLFWGEFLKGECKSINQYLGRRNYETHA